MGAEKQGGRGGERGRMRGKGEATYGEGGEQIRGNLGLTKPFTLNHGSNIRYRELLTDCHEVTLHDSKESSANGFSMGMVRSSP